MVRIALVILSLLPLAAFSQTNIEKNFTPDNTADLSGSYAVTGLLPDSTEYTGSLKMESWHTFTTPQGNTLQSFKMEYVSGEKKSNGVAVFDGSRLYYATGEGDRDNYYLLLLSKLELAQAARSALRDYWERNWGSKEVEGKYFEWEGKEPWYGYIDKDAQAYGFYFWIDGTYGQYDTHKNGFPFSPDTGRWKMLELNEDGSFGSKQGKFDPKGYSEWGNVVAQPDGDNLRISMDYLHVTTEVNEEAYWGTGMMTAHPRTGDAMLVAMLGGPDNASVGWMDVSGRTMIGAWAGVGSDGRGSETWAVPDGVVEKNPGLFK